MPRPRVLLADDHALLLAAFEKLLADHCEVVGMVLRHAGALAVAGVLIGVALVVAAREPLSRVVFGVGPTDLLTCAVAAVCMFAIAWLAAWIPARRASRIDPVRALRAQ